MLEKLMNLSDEALDELSDAYAYAEKAIRCKELSSNHAKMYYDMARDEMKHAGYLHEMARDCEAKMSETTSEMQSIIKNIFDKYYSKLANVKFYMQIFDETK